ncbi:hypothetical protein [Rhizobium leguminosarum]|uniref:hypothetical protein n=1 Tax=Rhizobium leguminosarum TaxID=384 RepID=UPI00103BD6A3|nr:hypothetical protein [Rhizobium leguminosarum]TCA02759.1 hypothetical protein E0H63_17895 [Rhizobium leguminosarum bv. viciae]
MTAAAVDEDLARRLSIGLRAYFSFVIAVGLALPLLSFLQYKEAIHRVAWLSDAGRSMLPWAAFIAIAFIVFQKFVRRSCMSIAAWALETPGDRYRFVVIGCCLLIFTSYSWQLHIGIAHRGVPGWVYAGLPDVIQHDEPANLSLPPDIDPATFKAALQPWVMPYIHRSGYASSEVLFLHFKDGTMRPANYELAMVSWPKSTFGLANGQMTHGPEFLAIVKHNFANRRAGGAFLLPGAISYPSHLNYQRIDYRGYPAADEIVGASLWTLTVRIDEPAGVVNVVGATKVAQVNE